MSGYTSRLYDNLRDKHVNYVSFSHLWFNFVSNISTDIDWKLISGNINLTMKLILTNIDRFEWVATSNIFFDTS